MSTSTFFKWQDDSFQLDFANESLRTHSFGKDFKKRISLIRVSLQYLHSERTDLLHAISIIARRYGRFLQKQYSFPYVDNVYYLCDGLESHSMGEKFMGILGSKARRITLQATESNVQLSTTQFLKMCINFSNQLDSIIFSSWSSSDISKMIEEVEFNYNVKQYGLIIEPHLGELQENNLLAHYIKRSSKIEKLEIRGVLAIGLWLRDWSPRNTLHSLKLILNKSFEKIQFACLFENCPLLVHLSLRTTGMDSNSVLQVFKAVGASLLEEFEFVHSSVDLMTWREAQKYLHQSKLKLLKIPNLLGDDLKITSLEELHCSVKKVPEEGSSVLHNNTNLKCWKVCDQTSSIESDLRDDPDEVLARVSHFLIEIPANKTLHSLFLPKKFLEDDDFAQLFSILKQNSNLTFLKAKISLRSNVQLLVVIDYLESNSGGLEMIHLEGRFDSLTNRVQEMLLIGKKHEEEAERLMRSLSTNTHIISFWFPELSMREAVILECIAANNNHRLVDLKVDMFDEQLQEIEEIVEKDCIQEALRNNRENFQRECRRLLVLKLHSLGSALMEKNILKTVSSMSSNLQVFSKQVLHPADEEDSLYGDEWDF
jgi:hypothetical protein